jgi:hypothetical protein
MQIQCWNLEILDFLRVSRQRRVNIVEEVTIESAKALCSLHQIRYQVFNLSRPQARLRSSNAASSRTTAQAQNGTFDTDDPSAGSERGVEDARSDVGENQVV